MIPQNILNRLTISGFRGVLGVELTDQVIVDLTKSFVQILKKQTNKDKLNILIGRDGRQSGEDIEQLIVGTLVNLGCDVTVGGILTTPSVMYLTKTLTFEGSLIITASHNPAEYNGIKFVLGNGFFAPQEFINEMKNLLSDPVHLEVGPPSEQGVAIVDNTLAKTYIDHIVGSFSKLKTKFRVIVDPVNSSGSLMAQEFLRSLGCDVIMINDEPIGTFNRPPEPNPQALLELGRATLGYAMDIGFGLDPDGDRLVIVDENGIPVFEEYTLALCAESLYKKLEKENAISSAGSFITNLSTSATGDDIAKKYGVKTMKSPVGEPNVVKKMIENNSMFGGEGNGGVIFRPVNFCRDSFVGMALILNLMDETGKKISELVNELPKYIMAKEKVTGITNFKDYIPNIENLFPEASFDYQDGLYMSFPDSSWLQVRASNTEPIVRIYGEVKDSDEGTTKTQDKMDELVSKVKEVLV